MSPEENFGELHHCKNLNFKNWQVPTENGKTRTRLDKMQGSLEFMLKSRLSVFLSSALIVKQNLNSDGLQFLQYL